MGTVVRGFTILMASMPCFASMVTIMPSTFVPPRCSSARSTLGKRRGISPRRSWIKVSPLIYMRSRFSPALSAKSSMLPITGGSNFPRGPGPWVPGIAVMRTLASPFWISSGSQVPRAWARVKPTRSRYLVAWLVETMGVALLSLRSATRSKWSPCRCESRTKSSGGRSSISTAGLVTRREVRPYPRCTWSPACKKFGSVKIVKPAYRIMTVAVPTKKIEPLPKSGSSFLLGSTSDFPSLITVSRPSSPGQTRRLVRLRESPQVFHDLLRTGELGSAQALKHPGHGVRGAILLSSVDDLFFARREIDAFQVPLSVVGVEVHSGLPRRGSLRLYSPDARYRNATAPRVPGKRRGPRAGSRRAGPGTGSLASAARREAVRDAACRRPRSRAPPPARTPSYGQILVFAGLREGEKARKNGGVAFG